jgi:hypothetical protein
MEKRAIQDSGCFSRLVAKAGLGREPLWVEVGTKRCNHDQDGKDDLAFDKIHCHLL